MPDLTCRPVPAEDVLTCPTTMVKNDLDFEVTCVDRTPRTRERGEPWTCI